MFLLAIATCLLLIGACKEKENTTAEVVEDEVVTRLPNESDAHFSEALSTLHNAKKTETLDHLAKGIAALKIEGNNIKGQAKASLDLAISNLSSLKMQMEKGKNIGAHQLREAIANAEVHIAHDYLTTTGIYILETPVAVAKRNSSLNFSLGMGALEQQIASMKEDVQFEANTLMAEGKKLQAEKDALEKKIQENSKKTQALLKKHKPEAFQAIPYFGIE